MNESLVVGVGQMTSSDDISQNLLTIETTVGSKRGADLWSFPENCLFLRASSKDTIPDITLEHPVFKRLQDLADREQVSIHLGSVPLKRGRERFNSTVLISPHSPPEHVYDKIHLFDHQVTAGAASRESDSFKAGSSPVVVEVKGWKLGLAICYDLRFTELFTIYGRQQVDAIMIPSAFLVETGLVHWEILLRARAIENQTYVIAAAQAGEHRFSDGKMRKTYGHSMVVHPWGEVIWEARTDKPESAVVRLERSELKAVRERIPMNSHRRLGTDLSERQRSFHD